MSIFSYRGEVTIGVMVNAALVPDPGTLASEIEKEIEPGQLAAERRDATRGPKGPPREAGGDAQGRARADEGARRSRAASASSTCQGASRNLRIAPALLSGSSSRKR